jgi:hypothetical protein
MEVGAAVVVNICTCSIGLDGERRATRTVSIQSKRAVLPLFFFSKDPKPKSSLTNSRQKKSQYGRGVRCLVWLPVADWQWYHSSGRF